MAKTRLKINSQFPEFTKLATTGSCKDVPHGGFIGTDLLALSASEFNDNIDLVLFVSCPVVSYKS